jgi:ammonia channel protein AmtB
MAVTASVTAVLASVVGAVTHYTSTLDRRSFRGPIYIPTGTIHGLVQLYEGWF